MRMKTSTMAKNQENNNDKKPSVESKWMDVLHFLNSSFFFLGLKEKIYILRLWIEVEDGQNHVRKRSQDLGGVWRMNKP